MVFGCVFLCCAEGWAVERINVGRGGNNIHICGLQLDMQKVALVGSYSLYGVEPIPPL